MKKKLFLVLWAAALLPSIGRAVPVCESCSETFKEVVDARHPVCAPTSTVAGQVGGRTPGAEPERPLLKAQDVLQLRKLSGVTLAQLQAYGIWGGSQVLVRCPFGGC